MMYPLYPYMVKSLLPGDSAIGYHTGLLQSAYFLPSVVSAPAFGHLSDVLGRRKMLLVGLAGYGIGTLVLGISLQYWQAVLAMVAMGFFSGNATVAKSMIGEVAVDDHTRALGYSAYGIAYAVFSMLGAIAGTQLADLHILSAIPFFADRKYFGASLFGFFLATCCLVLTRLLLEDEPPLVRPAFSAVKSDDDAIEPIMPIPKIRLQRYQTHASSAKHPLAVLYRWVFDKCERLYSNVLPYLAILNRHTLTPLILYTLYAFTNSLLHTAIPLVSASDKGHALPQRRTSQIAMYASFAKLFAKIAYMGVHGVLGTLNTYRVGTALLVPAIAAVAGEWPFARGAGSADSPAFVCGLLVVGIGESWAYLALVMLITEGAHTHEQGKNALGLVHGVSGCLAAVVRTVGPACAGVLWELFGGAVLFGSVASIVVLQLVLCVALVRGRRFRTQQTV
ncbi:hypothetical protein HDU82_008206 [Entophlyctis luteolus]|nr:hypothetical protein HDU82_008206 [Entophlyctis luteolus]